jgi:hypothetical protein
VEPGVINKIKQLHNTGQNLESVTLKSIRPSHIAATSCHYAPDSGCKLLCDNLLKIYSKKIEQNLLPEFHILGSNRKKIEL